MQAFDFANFNPSVPTISGDKTSAYIGFKHAKNYTSKFKRGQRIKGKGFIAVISICCIACAKVKQVAVRLMSPRLLMKLHTITWLKNVKVKRRQTAQLTPCKEKCVTTYLTGEK
jgi:hypothetical protein